MKDINYMLKKVVKNYINLFQQKMQKHMVLVNQENQENPKNLNQKENQENQENQENLIKHILIDIKEVVN